MKECIFCKISNGEIQGEKIYENDNFFSIPDANPIAEGHSLIISKRHFATTLELPNTIGAELLDCIKSTSLILMKKYGSNGFNITNNNFKSAGQVVSHVHFHILPRKEGDNKRGIYLG
ncbi:HIT family protein [Candidatus Pacearchaeota archaeon CG10_big_fil_rev_8_21_14_0_10_34_12]|nr:MAG: HIT family protein [Candidatus Pacearchaeota archaeon CG10_big_fil_rev_8_21_14_0_10_34_12]